MPFTKDNATVVHYPGTTKEAVERGYEIVDATSSAPGPFRDSCQSADRNGWRHGQKQKNRGVRDEEHRAAHPDWYED